MRKKEKPRINFFRFRSNILSFIQSSDILDFYEFKTSIIILNRILSSRKIKALFSIKINMPLFEVVIFDSTFEDLQNDLKVYLSNKTYYGNCISIDNRLYLDIQNLKKLLNWANPSNIIQPQKIEVNLK